MQNQADKRPKKDAVEVSSQLIQDELVAIKDRLNAIETIQSISNAAVVKQYVQEHLKTKDAKKIMKECEEARTRSHLQTTFSYKSGQALDHHLKPLRHYRGIVENGGLRRLRREVARTGAESFRPQLNPNTPCSYVGWRIAP